MPIYVIFCADCGNVAKTLVLAGCRMPEEWSCSACGGARAGPDLAAAPEPHPWEMGHGAGCLCCGAASSRSPQSSAFECTETTRPRDDAQTPTGQHDI
jgi:hypothetical protein